MFIDQNLCTGCENCIPYCPMRAIKVNKGTGEVEIDQDECVECEICARSGACPTGALYMPELEWPRILRNRFSNPLIPHPDTQVPGRGTEEMKTNEVTGRFKRGQAGVAIEMGRPGIGARFYDIEKVAMAIASLGVRFEPHNPLTALMVDKATGKLPEEILNERVLSAIIEFDIPQNKLPEVLSRLLEVQKEISTVFSLDLICRLEADLSNPAAQIAQGLGYRLSPNGKTNVGLGRPLCKEE